MYLIDTRKYDDAFLLAKILEKVDFSDEEEKKLFKHFEKPEAVDAEPVRHGHWIRNDNGTYSCSECHSWIPDEQHYYARYCLFCGTKMDEVTENA